MNDQYDLYCLLKLNELDGVSSARQDDVACGCQDYLTDQGYDASGQIAE